MKNLISIIYFPLTLISLVISLAVISISHGATLTWNQNSEDDLAGYKLWVGLSSEEHRWLIPVGNVTNYEIPTSWPENVTYYVALIAYDTTGLESNCSDELVFKLVLDINPSDEDADSDSILDDEDNCPDDYNPEQEDNDNDGLGNVCDPDDDNDGVYDSQDNCPETPNGIFGTCKSGYIGYIGYICTFDNSCGPGGFCSMNQEDTDDDGLGDVCDPDADDDGISNDQDDCPFDPDNDIDNDNICGDVDNCPDHYNPGQEDTYPPDGNGCGDACECEGDFDGDQGVTAIDVTSFLKDFGRNLYIEPCTNNNPCNGDFNCDGNVAADDQAKMFEDYGRNIYFNPCPTCSGYICEY